MVMKLSRPSTGAAPAQETAAAPQPRGWGRASAAAEPAAEQPAQEQRERIQEQLTGQAPNVTDARAAFGRRINEERAAISAGQEAEHTPGTSNGVCMDPEPPKQTRTRAPKGDPAAPSEPPVVNVDAKHSVTVPDTSAAILTQARVEVLKVAFNDPQTSLEDGLEIANELWKWASEAA